MRISTHSRFGSLMGTLLVCLSTALILCSCKKTPQQKMLGTWNVDGKQSVVEFHKDGTFLTTENGNETRGNYHFIDGSHMQMEINGAVQGTNTIHLSVDFEVAFHGDKADLTVTIPRKDGSPAVSQTLHYTRAN